MKSTVIVLGMILSASSAFAKTMTCDITPIRTFGNASAPNIELALEETVTIKSKIAGSAELVAEGNGLNRVKTAYGQINLFVAEEDFVGGYMVMADLETNTDVITQRLSYGTSKKDASQVVLLDSERSMAQSLLDIAEKNKMGMDPHMSPDWALTEMQIRALAAKAPIAEGQLATVNVSCKLDK